MTPDDANQDSLAPRENDALREALSQLARRVRYLESLPYSSGADSRPHYAKGWLGEGDTQSIPNETLTLVYFTEGERTHGSYLTPSSPPYYRITVPSGLAGIHTPSAGVVFESNATGQRRLLLLVNGSEELVAMQVDAAAYFATELNVSAPAWLDDGYFVEAWVHQNSGGSLLIGQVS